MRFHFLLLAALSLATSAIAQPADGYRLLKLDGRLVKWGDPALGAGAVLTYGFAAAPEQYEDARNCRSLEPVDAILARASVERAVFEEEVAAAFALWQRVANVIFTKADDPHSADILIGVDADALGWAHADVLAAPNGEPVGKVSRGLICLNAQQAWKVGFGAAPEAQDLRYTIAHEIGHVIGLNHPGPSGQLMSFTYSEDFAGLQPGDINGVQALYGLPAAPGAHAAAAGQAGPSAP